MPGVRGGLPTPRTADATLNRWIELVSERIGPISTLATTASNAALRAQNAALRAQNAAEVVLAPAPGDDDRPDEPTGFMPELQGRAGIEITALWWPNPFTAYRNHGVTRVFRHTANEFNNAVLIGQSSGIGYIDLQVVGDTTYWYWIVWESNSSTLSNPSNAVELTPVISPTDAIAALTEEILNDPLTLSLLSSIDSDETVARIAERVAALRDYINEQLRRRALMAETSAREAALRLETSAREAALMAEELARETALRLETSAREAALMAEETARGLADQLLSESIAGQMVLIAQLQASIGPNLGPEENEFSGVDEAAAEAARDAYAAANPVWLSMYDDNPNFAIELTWQ